MNNQAPKRSRELFNTGYYCAESVVMAIAESRGIQSDLIPRIATGFCSGMARSGGQCGAVSGGMLGINLATGRRSPTETVDRNYTLIQELMRRFEERFGSTNCRVLLGCDLGTAEGQETFQAKHLIEQCFDYAEGATQIALSLLEAQGQAESES
ncbi:MAG: C_GCAxxG_C_C family protein [Chloroflexi bacterium]|nr:C_GCAxxG_C_C family protein [Chloroflexota bacterium]